MRTRLILATAVSLSMIGAASFAVNHPSFVASVAHLGAQDAAQEAVAVEAVMTETTEVASTEAAMEVPAAETAEAVEVVETVEAEVVVEQTVETETTDHADHSDMEVPADSIETETEVTPEG